MVTTNIRRKSAIVLDAILCDLLWWPSTVLMTGGSDYAFSPALSEGASGKRILKEETVRLMATNRLTTEQRYCKRFREFHHLKGYGYGLGVRVMLDVSESGGVGTVGEFGWDGAAGSVLLADPERKISMFYAQHLLNDDNHLEELRDALYRSL